MKLDESKGRKRAKKFIKHYEHIDHLREMRKKEKEKGSITDKDLTLEVPAQDWPYLCNENYTLFLEERSRAKDLATRTILKQKEYIFRE